MNASALCDLWAPVMFWKFWNITSDHKSRNARAIAHFRVAACLNFKTSPGTQPFKFKWVAYSYANQAHFPYNSWVPRLTLKPRLTATRKWPISRDFFYYILNKITSSLCFHSNFRIALYNLFMHSSLTNQKCDILLSILMSQMSSCECWPKNATLSLKILKFVMADH